jgi:monoamine oxidase
MSISPRPVEFAVSRWGEDPWSRGSWSLIGRDGSPADRSALGEPIGRRLRIAGEATHATRSGMTHGAYEQGVAAATGAAEAGHSRVAVVGAGMAGLGAARELVARGVEVRVWEARDRVGGRTAGVTLGGTGFDLGANWLQQYDENVLARLAEELGLTTVATDFNDPLVLGPEPSGGGDLSGGHGLSAGGDLGEELRGRLAGAAEGASIADVLDDWLRDPHPWTREAVRRLVDAEIVMDAGAPLDRMSARHGFEAGVGEGDRWIIGGYRLLVDHLAGGLDIRLRQAVRGIQVYGDGVLLTGDDDTLRADAVIVTAPVSVLGRIAFTPPLPSTHLAALGRLGMGRVEKVLLRFDERFWPRHESGYYRIHGPGDGCMSEWLDATAADGVPTLVGLFAGPWLEALWAGTDAEVAARTTEVVIKAVEE